MIQIKQKTIPTAQLQHRFVQGESGVEKVAFFVPNIEGINFQDLLFSIALFAEERNRTVDGELERDVTEAGVILFWDVEAKYTAYGGDSKIQIDGINAGGEVIYRAISGTFCITKSVTGDDPIVPGDDPSAELDFEIDKTLKYEDGVLSVNTAKVVEKDNTLPITSAAVHTTVGNIEVLLSTI